MRAAAAYVLFLAHLIQVRCCTLYLPYSATTRRGFSSVFDSYGHVRCHGSNGADGARNGADLPTILPSVKSLQLVTRVARSNNSSAVSRSFDRIL